MDALKHNVHNYLWQYKDIHGYINTTGMQLSLSTLVLNGRDRQGNVWLPQKWAYRTTLQHFPSKYCHKIYLYDAINTINPLKKLKCALESKLSNFKNFENC